jgi:arsenite methyltransferase
VTATQLPEGVTCDAALWAACIGGAMQRDDYRAAIETAGFAIETWRENPPYRFVADRADDATTTKSSRGRCGDARAARGESP